MSRGRYALEWARIATGSPLYLATAYPAGLAPDRFVAPYLHLARLDQGSTALGAGIELGYADGAAHFRVALGLDAVERPTVRLGSHSEFFLAVILERGGFRLAFVHWSNGDGVTHWGQPNVGENGITIGWRW